jgi:hypothetical protein
MNSYPGEKTVIERMKTYQAYLSIENEQDRIAQMICDITDLRLRVASLIEKWEVRG